MATTTNYGWTTPDDTALVKDGASAIRTLGSSVDTTTKNLNPETTLGDIAYRSSSANVKTRLGIGTAGQILTVSGGVPAWTTPASGGGNDFTLLNSGGTALSGSSTVTISSISGKNTIMVVVGGASPTSGNSKIYIRFNGNTTVADYEKYGSGIDNQSSYNAGQFYALGGAIGGEAWIELSENSAAGTVSGYLTMYGCNTTNPKVYQSIGANNGNDGKRYFVGGVYKEAATISSISIISSSTNFDAGTVYVYASAV